MDSGSIYKRELIREARRAQVAVQQMLTDDLRQRATVCVAGSAALQWYLLRHEEGQITHSVFKPNDIDIFVFGRDGESESVFLESVWKMVNKLGEAGKTELQIDQRTNMYVLRNTPVSIVDVRVRGIETKLSFVQCPADNTADGVVGRFDFDIVKVIYNIAEDKFRVQKLVARSIAQRCACARDTRCRFSAPDHFELQSYMSTLRRIRTYSKRGFHFKRCPILTCDADNTGEKDTDPGLLVGRMTDVDIEWTGDVVHKILDFMWDVIPAHVLRRGTMGLAGELLLTKTIGENNGVMAPRIVAPWKVGYANIYVCGMDGMSKEAFKESMEVIARRLTKSRRHVGLTRSATKLSDGACKRTDILEVRLRGVNAIIRFVRCPGAENIRALMESTLIGIERIYYNFDKSACELCPGVEEQLMTGMVRVDDKIIKATHPDPTEMSEFRYLIRRMMRYHSQGFLFDTLPALVGQS